MNHASFFTGIGGFDIAARQCGIETVFQCEINPYCRKLLAQNFPEVKICYENIVGQNFTPWRNKIDIISGGFPCTQTSVAAAISGSRKGLAGKDSGLWFEYLRAIGEIGADYVLIENVGGVSQWESIIQTGLAALGYQVSRLAVKADHYGLPHQRRRYIYIADSYGPGLAIPRRSSAPTTEWVKRLTASGRPWLAGTPGTVGIFNGLPNRVDRVKALGNSFSPLIALDLFQAILKIV